MSEIKETIERVRRLAKYATPGPWRVGETDACPEGDADMVYAADGPLCGPFAREADAALISAYRADALALADEVERLNGLLASDTTVDANGNTIRLSVRLPDTAYRPGLPTVEQVQAHEARGGWWMWRGLDWDAGNSSEFARPGHTPGSRCLDPADYSTLPWRFEWTTALWRPCLPDGTPCPWPV